MSELADSGRGSVLCQRHIYRPSLCGRSNSPWFIAIAPSRLVSSEPAQPSQGGQARHEEVLAPSKHVERFDAVNATSDRLVRNRERRPFLLEPYDRVALMAGPDEIAVVDPFLLQEFDGRHRLGADEQEVGAALNGVIRQHVRIVRRAIRRAAPDNAMDVHIGQTREFRVPRVHTPDMASERYLQAARVIRVIEVVVPLRVRAEGTI